jgi:hypothetical protein
MRRYTLPLRTMATVVGCLGLCSCDPSLIVSGQPDYRLARTLSGADREADVAWACGLRTGTGQAAAVTDLAPTTATAGNCYWTGKNAIDYKYQVYKTNLLHAVNDGSAFGDFAVLALNTAGTITPGATAAKLFNALAAGVTGAKTLINQDILYKQTVTILISEMDSDREVAAKIGAAAVAQSKSQAEIVNDLLAYYEAGTFQHALVAVQNKAGGPSPSDNNKTADADAKNPSPNPGAPAVPASPTVNVKG